MSERDEPIFGIDLGELRNVKASQLAVRFAFGAIISVAAGLGGIYLGSIVGGMLLAFPAIAPAALTLIEKEDGNAAAVHDVGGAVFGGVGLIAFAVVGALLFDRTAAPLVLLASVGAWAVVSVALYVLRAEERIPLPEAIRGRAPGSPRRRR